LFSDRQNNLPGSARPYPEHTLPADISAAAKSLSKFLMVAALAAIGLNTSFDEMAKSGILPMVHGFIISALVVVVAIGVEWCMGLV